MEERIASMLSFGNEGGLRSFKLYEVNKSESLGDLISQYGPENWGSDHSDVFVKISSSKSGGFDKFSTRNTVDLVVKVLKTDVLWVVFERSVTKSIPQVKNAFDLLKRAQVEKALPPKIESPINQKQELFNTIIDKFAGENVNFSATECAPKKKHQPTGQGTQLVLDLADIVWKIGQSEKQLSGRGLWNKVPTELTKLISFEIKSKDPVQLSQLSTKNFAIQIRETADKILMAKQVLGPLRVALLKAAEVYDEYSSWLKSNNESRTRRAESQKTIGSATEAIVQQIGEREKVTLVEKGNKPLNNPIAIKIFNEMKSNDHYVPVNISVLLPTNKSSRYYILNSAIPSQAPEKFVIWSFQNGSRAPQSLFAIPVDQDDTTEQIFVKIGQIKPQLQNLQTMFYPLEFYQQFYDQVGAVTGITAKNLKMVSSMILGDGRKFVGDVQERFEEAIMSGDPDYVFDLRHFNGREIKFKQFLSEFRSAVEEYMVEDRGRHEIQYDGTIVSKVSMGFSLRSVFEEVCKKVKEKLPLCPLPASENFLHRYLIPRTRAAAETLTRQAPLIPLKLTSQQKIIEKPNVDAHYNAAQYKYLKNMAVELGTDLVTLIGWDDKTGVDVGEPEQPTAATQHTGKSWTHQNTVAGEGQHSFHKTNLTPSVRFVHEIPEDMTGSFYRGQPQVSIKDAIFQPSSSSRHAVELAQMFHSRPEYVKPVLFLTNDGGSDHTIRYERNVVAMLALFLHFPQIELLINFQMAAYRSAYHPVEKMNCLLNLAWNGISLAREKLEDPVLERAFVSCNSMKDARKAAVKHPGLTAAVSECLKPAIKVLEERAVQANLKGNFFETFHPASALELEEFFEILKEVDDKFEVDEFLDKSKTYHYSPGIKSYIDKHLVFTYYSVSFMRDKDSTVQSLKQKNPSIDWPADLETVPCPVPDKENPEKYLNFTELKKSAKDFSDRCRPGKHQKTPSNIPFTKNKQRALYGAPIEMVCEQCGKQRVVYFKYRPTKVQIKEAADALKLVRYICGGRVSSFGRSLAVVEEITGARSNILEICDEIDNSQIISEPIEKEKVASEYTSESEESFEDGTNEPDVTALDVQFIPDETVYDDASELEDTYDASLREPNETIDHNSNNSGWKVGKCSFCCKLETGHKCKNCKRLCCNLCNTVWVEELHDIVCPSCSEEVQDEIDLESEQKSKPVVKKKRGRPAKVVPSGKILISLEKRKRGRPTNPNKKTEQVKRPRGRPSKASISLVVDDISEESSDEEESDEKLSELRIMGKSNILCKVFVDEALTCDLPVETHLFDVFISVGKPLPCYYCGEQEIKNISATITDEKFPLCKKCKDSGRGPAARRKSRKIKPKPVKKQKPATKQPKVKKRRPLI